MKRGEYLQTRWKSIFKIALLFTLFILAIFAFLGRGYVTNNSKHILTILGDFGSLGYGIILLFWILASICGVFPLSLLAIISGVFFGLKEGFFLSCIGLFIGALIPFPISRYVFRKHIESWISKRLSITVFDEEIKRRGWHFVLLLRLSPVLPFSIISYSFGLTRVSLKDYVIGSAGALPALFAYVYTGSISGLAFREFGNTGIEHNWARWLALAVGLMATLIAVLIIAHVARKSLSTEIFQQRREN